MGKNLIGIVFATQQVADSDEHRLLSGLRNSRLKDAKLRHEFYQRVIQCLDMEGNYLLLMAADEYECPARARTAPPWTTPRMRCSSISCAASAR